MRQFLKGNKMPRALSGGMAGDRQTRPAAHAVTIRLRRVEVLVEVLIMARI